jgi:hypothetical protein
MFVQLCRPAHQPNRVRRYEQVVQYCRQFHERTGEVPSYSTIAAALGIHDRSDVRKYVAQAERMGFLTRSGEYTGGSGRTKGQRIRLGTPQEAAEGHQSIRFGREAED